MKTASNSSGSHSAMRLGVEVLPETILEQLGAIEGTLHRELLIEEHADQEGETRRSRADDWLRSDSVKGRWSGRSMDRTVVLRRGCESGRRGPATRRGRKAAIGGRLSARSVHAHSDVTVW